MTETVKAGEVLKPCPFCGSIFIEDLPPTCTERSPYNPADRAFPVVRCAECLAEAPGEDWDHTKASAIAAWNRRAPDPSREAVIAELVGALADFKDAAFYLSACGATSSKIPKPIFELALAQKMAAAPELYAVAVEGDALVDGDLTGAEWKAACHRYLANVRAALLKAEGRSDA